MGFLNLMPANPGLPVADPSAGTSTGTLQRLTITGEWYVSASDNLTAYTMILTLTPALSAVLAAIDAGDDLSLAAGYSGVSFMAGAGVPCVQVGLTGTNGNASSAASDATLDNLGLTLTADTYYRLTGWVEWHQVTANAGSTEPSNLFHFGWQLQTINKPGGLVTATLADITWTSLGYFALGVLSPGALYLPLDDMPPSSFITYRANRQPALNYQYGAGPGQFDAGYDSNPATSDGFSTAVLALSPTCYYRCQERLGTTAWDSSPNGNNGGFNEWNSEPSAYDIMGFPGAIPGTAAYANLTGTTTNNFGLVSNQALDTAAFTVQMAVMANSWGGNPRLAATDHTDSTSNGFQLAYGSFDGGTIEADIGNGTTSYAAYSTTALNTGEWYLVHAVYTGSALTVYVNGAQVATAATSGTATAGADHLTFGYCPVGNFGDFDGAHQDDAYWAGVALSASQIADLYTAWTQAGA